MSQTVHEAIKERHSGRTYEPSKKVQKEHLNKIIEAGRVAPSCYNDQPWSFLVTEREETPEAYAKLLDTLAKENQEWAKNAPILIMVCANTQYKRNSKPNRWGPYDAGAAAYSMMLEAYALGLMAHQMGGFDERKAAVDFAVPENFVPYAVMALGYELNPGTQKREINRLPVGELFFWGSWGKGVS